jgi:O-antigen ligase
VQFEASPDSFINRTAGLGEAEQLMAGGGKIRPPGTFSFISGPVFYMSLAAAFLIYGALTRTVYRNWLLIAGGGALVLGIVVSGSRSVVAAVLLVVLSVVAIFAVRPKAVNQFGRTLLIIVIGALIVTRVPIFKEGAHILSDRFTESAQATDSSITGGMIERIVGGFTEGFKHIDKFPIFGYGIGIGTNVGGRILMGRAAFLLAENEWSRVLAESGPILGLSFLLWRTLLTLQLARLSFGALRRDSLLPILIFSSGFSMLLNGQLGQPTTLGFAAFVNGLCLAATRPRLPDPSAIVPPMIEQPVTKPLPRRSAFANRLHGPEIAAEHNNGSVDR